MQAARKQLQGPVVLLGKSPLQVQQLVALVQLLGEPGHRVQLLQKPGIKGHAGQSRFSALSPGTYLTFYQLSSPQNEQSFRKIIVSPRD